MSMQGEEAIITGIESDAQTEIQRVLSDAKAYAEAKKKTAQNQVKILLEKGRTDTEASVELMQKTEISALSVETRRQILALREKICAHIIERIEENLEALPQNKDRYRELLLNWTTEALAGLDADEAVISVSRIDQQFMDEQLIITAAEQAGTMTGRKIHAELGMQNEIKQGVFVRTKDGKMGFNNQIQTRLRRMEDRIRERIQKSLFVDGEMEI